MGTVVKMTLTAYGDGAFSQKKGQYEAMINPEKLSLNRAVEYNSEQAPDNSAPILKYKLSNAADLNFDLVLDGTGIVDDQRLDLAKEIKDLKAICYDYQADIHRPYFVMLQWGLGEVFKGVLTKFDTSYELFDPDGKPLRVKVSLAFKAYVDPTTLAKEEDKNSPDLTHLVRVKAGDTLPGLCQQIYRNPMYYIQVARVNKLDSVRQLTPGTLLTFPPIDFSAQEVVS